MGGFGVSGLGSGIFRVRALGCRVYRRVWRSLPVALALPATRLRPQPPEGPCRIDRFLIRFVGALSRRIVRVPLNGSKTRALMSYGNGSRAQGFVGNEFSRSF